MVTPAGPKCLRAKLLCCVFDLPARAMALNLTQWNGRFGCTHCMDEGKQVSHVRIYLPGDQHKSRTDKDIAEYTKKATRNVPVYGVKGAFVLSPYLNIVKDSHRLHACRPRRCCKNYAAKVLAERKIQRLPLLFIQGFKGNRQIALRYKTTT